MNSFEDISVVQKCKLLKSVFGKYKNAPMRFIKDGIRISARQKATGGQQS